MDIDGLRRQQLEALAADVDFITTRVNGINTEIAGFDTSIDSMEVLLNSWPTEAEWAQWLADWSAQGVLTETNLENAEFMVTWIAANQPLLDQIGADLQAVLSATPVPPPVWPTPAPSGGTVIEDCYKCFGSD